jgi:mono/diheme cytochrome c family protein
MAIGSKKSFEFSLVAITLAVALNISGKLITQVQGASKADDPIVLFNDNCSICHDRSGRGVPAWRTRGQPNFTDIKWQKSRTDRQLFQSISNGKGGNMPRWKGKLSAAQINLLIKRVRLFAPTENSPKKNTKGHQTQSGSLTVILY